MEYTKKVITSKFLESGLKASSSANYASNLITIVRRLSEGNNDVLKGKTETWFNKEEFDNKFIQLKQNTIRNYISSVVAWMKVKGEEDTKLYKALSQDRDEYNMAYEKIIEKGEKNPYEEAMWVDPETLGNIFEMKILPFLNRLGFTSVRRNMSDFNNFDHRELKKARDYVVLAVYLFPFFDIGGNFGVIRNDIGTLILSNGKNMEEGKNYFVIKNGKYFFHMEDYKTKKTHGAIDIPIPPLLGLIIKRWSLFSEKEMGEKVFLNITKHKVTGILQKNLKGLVGKPLGTQMLRKIYISGRFGDQIKNQKDIANSMMHNVETQTTVYNKV